MAKEWKPGLDQCPSGDARLWGDTSSASTRVYCLRLGWREYYFTRGEILLTLFVGLFIGLIVAAGQAGYLKLPDRHPQLGVYEPPEPRLLGSSEPTRPEAGDPDVHFVDGRGNAAVSPPSPAEEGAAAPAAAPPATALAGEGRSEPGSIGIEPEPAT